MDSLAGGIAIATKFAAQIASSAGTHHLITAPPASTDSTRPAIIATIPAALSQPIASRAETETASHARQATVLEQMPIGAVQTVKCGIVRIVKIAPPIIQTVQPAPLRAAALVIWNASAVSPVTI